MRPPELSFEQKIARLKERQALEELELRAQLLKEVQAEAAKKPVVHELLDTAELVLQRKKERQAKYKLVSPSALISRLRALLATRHNMPRESVLTDPLELLLTLTAGFVPDDAILRGVDENTPIPMNQRIEAAKAALPYTRSPMPKEISGPNGGPIPLAQAVVDMTDMMRDPVMRTQIENLQIQLALRRAPAANLETPDTLVIETTSEPVEETENGPALDPGPDSDVPGKDRE